MTLKAAINDLGPVEAIAYFLQYDCVHGRFPAKVKISDNTIDVGRWSLLSAE